MNEHRMFIENGMTVDQIVLKALVTESLITESDYKNFNSYMLLEASNNAGTYYYKNRPIDRDIFKVVYSDPRNHPERMDIFNTLGYIASDFGTDARKITQNVNKQLNRILDHFNASREEDKGDEFFPLFKDRSKFYSSNRDEMEDDQEMPSYDSIDAGRKNTKNRTTKAFEKINSEDLLRGSFYADMTKIPKTRWSAFWKFWSKETSSIKGQNARWKKTFVMGYQVEQNLFYEVWYNSVDSTFTIHEPNGTDVSGRARTLNEAVSNLVRMIAQKSKEDALVFNGNNPEAKQLARSMLRSVSDGVDPRVKELIRLDDSEAKRRRDDLATAARDKKTRYQRAFAKLKSLTTSNRTVDVFDTDIEIGSGIPKEEPKQDKPTGFKKKENIVTPDVIKHYDREMTIRAELDAKRKEQQEADRKAKWNKDMIDGIPSAANNYKGSSLETDTPAVSSYFDNLPSQSNGYKGSSLDKANKDQEQRNKKMKNSAKKKSGKTDKATDTTKTRQEEIKAKLKQIRDTELTETFNDSIVDAFEFINENASFLDETDEDFDVDIQELTQNNRYDNEMDQIRNQAERSTYTQRVLKDNIMGKVYTYEETRSLKNFPPKLFGGRLFSGRKDPIILPTDKGSIFKRAKMALFGQRFRADFIIGFSLDGKVDVEVWYITEPNPDRSSAKDTISTFYVFDVTSGRVLRRYLPYYRNTLPIVMAKIGVA
ncbi:hypothetical protein [Alishewanella phage vB_AspM_Slicko01]|nr:hypothetical protein [Alishewanella phage vB_AspM_Slicko01]